jgi:hypothetical protein
MMPRVMRVLVIILLLCTELFFAVGALYGPLLTSHKALGAATNRHRASPSRETLAEMERLRLIAEAEDRMRVQSNVVLLTLNTCGLVSMIWYVCLKRNATAKAAFQS